VRTAGGVLGRLRGPHDRDHLLDDAQRGVVFALACVLALDAADRTALGALAPALKSEFSIGNGEIGLLASAFSIVGGLATVPMGILTDRTRRITLIVVSIVIWTAAMGVAAAATTFAVLFVARIALGIVTAAGGPPVTSIVGDAFAPDIRGRVLGWVKSGELTGAGMGFLVTGVLVSFFSWRSVFVVLGAIGLLVAFRVSKVGEPPRGGGGGVAGEGELDQETELSELIEAEHIESKPELVVHEDLSEASLGTALGYVLRVRALALIIAATATGEFFFAALQVFGVLFLVDAFDVSTSTAALVIPAIGVAGFFGVIGGGRVGDRLIERGVITGRIHVGTWSYLIVSLLFVPVLLADSLAVALPFLVLVGVFLMAPVAPLEAARLDVVHPQLRGRAESARTLARVVAQSSAPLLFGVISEAFGGGADGLRIAFFVFLPFLALSSVLLVLAAREYPSEVASVQESTVTEDAG
jgi:sugar phosphate permease